MMCLAKDIKPGDIIIIDDDEFIEIKHISYLKYHSTIYGRLFCYNSEFGMVTRMLLDFERANIFKIEFENI